MTYPKIDKPTVPGWYWARWGGDWEPCDVDFVNGKDGPMNVWVYDSCWPLDHPWFTDWYGPIPFPEPTE